jgi:hypothetical protein
VVPTVRTIHLPLTAANEIVLEDLIVSVQFQAPTIQRAESHKGNPTLASLARLTKEIPHFFLQRTRRPTLSVRRRFLQRTHRPTYSVRRRSTSLSTRRFPASPSDEEAVQSDLELDVEREPRKRY